MKKMKIVNFDALKAIVIFSIIFSPLIFIYSLLLRGLPLLDPHFLGTSVTLALTHSIVGIICISSVLILLKVSLKAMKGLTFEIKDQ
tara:strand:+ start:574 stop:834 length:261 start_codon:yes stop_codon:yes gene_type:complete